MINHFHLIIKQRKLKFSSLTLKPSVDMSNDDSPSSSSHFHGVSLALILSLFMLIRISRLNKTRFFYGKPYYSP